tara:strand:- start:384 stop:641 length:258 start_codon:yes stop_codon:yes gene_type:complete
MEFPLPGKPNLVQLHREIFFKLGSPSADLFADFGNEYIALVKECDLWQSRAEALRATHQDFVNEDKNAIQNNLKDRYSQLRRKND